MQSIQEFFGSQAFRPHGHDYLWRPDILWLHVGSDAFIALACFSIPISLIYFLRRRGDVSFNWIVWMFAAFIFACGATHLVEIWTTWRPSYGVQGLVKATTAAVSM